MLLLQASKMPENQYAGGAEKKSDEGGHRSAFEIIGWPTTMIQIGVLRNMQAQAMCRQINWLAGDCES